MAAAAAMAGGAALWLVRGRPDQRGGFRELQWPDLIPAGWDPKLRLPAVSPATQLDGDPASARLLAELRAKLDSAPTVDALNGLDAKIAGYVVPLEGRQSDQTEFLLVPYFGACIHTPPPPANQIVHVTSMLPAPGPRAMETVWVSGRLTATRQVSAMGASGYQMKAVALERYVAP